MSHTDLFNMALVLCLFRFAPLVMFQPVGIQLHTQSRTFWNIQAALLIAQLTTSDHITFPLVIVGVKPVEGKRGNPITPDNVIADGIRKGKSCNM